MQWLRAQADFTIYVIFENGPVTLSEPYVSFLESADKKTCLVELLLWELNKVSHVQGKTHNPINNFMYGKVV